MTTREEMIEVCLNQHAAGNSLHLLSAELNRRHRGAAAQLQRDGELRKRIEEMVEKWRSYEGLLGPLIVAAAEDLSALLKEFP